MEPICFLMLFAYKIAMHLTDSFDDFGPLYALNELCLLNFSIVCSLTDTNS